MRPEYRQPFRGDDRIDFFVRIARLAGMAAALGDELAVSQAHLHPRGKDELEVAQAPLSVERSAAKARGDMRRVRP